MKGFAVVGDRPRLWRWACLERRDVVKASWRGAIGGEKRRWQWPGAACTKIVLTLSCNALIGGQRADTTMR